MAVGQVRGVPLPLPSAWLTTRGPGGAGGSGGGSGGGGSGMADAHAWGVRVEAADALARWQAIHAPRSGVASLAGSWRGRDLLRQCLLVLPNPHKNYTFRALFLIPPLPLNPSQTPLALALALALTLACDEP
jgi:hypothetical protein